MSIAATYNYMVGLYGEPATYEREGLPAFALTVAVEASDSPVDIDTGDIVQVALVLKTRIADLNAGGVTSEPIHPDKIFVRGRTREVLTSFAMRDEGGVVIGHQVTCRG